MIVVGLPLARSARPAQRATVAAADATRVVAIDGGHYACFTNVEQFLKAMRHHILPLAR